MNWKNLKNLKKLVIPFIIVKIIILVFVIFTGRISISREADYNTNYAEGFYSDSTFIKQQKFIRIVRNEEGHGFSINLRGKKNNKPLNGKEGEIDIPIID